MLVLSVLVLCGLCGWPAEAPIPEQSRLGPTDVTTYRTRDVMTDTAGDGCPVGDTRHPHHAKNAWFWLPEWRRKGDCGPVTLYLLMKVEGKAVSLDQVQQLVSLDPDRGSSIQGLAEAAEQLGFPVEVRFINPTKLTEIPRPFVFHGISSIKKSTGHYVLAVGYDEKEDVFYLIDPIREVSSTNPRDSVVRGFSGYVLMPQYHAIQKWDRIAGFSLLVTGVFILCLVFIEGCRWRTVTEACRHRLSSRSQGDGNV